MLGIDIFFIQVHCWWYETVFSHCLVNSTFWNVSDLQLRSCLTCSPAYTSRLGTSPEGDLSEGSLILLPGTNQAPKLFHDNAY